MEKEAVQQVLETLRPQIQLDGGDLELINVDERSGIVRVRLRGACVGCPLSSVTLEAGISAALRKKVKGFTAVELAEDYG
ncbi:MAG: hypothetical protein A3J59_01165 [Candidatus Buchananbacteria bacterium RIFCSPHIGHO2_02_FULL_56_16]|uniref:NIF system FeS cluster assembly NifU C-terminal domain-containing protein n=1 Tax=Candidatus Buchananbacteria bacterium RIFCSPHIGHO2_02_FULL_56_16 TaxID=1797542 RepID=A0A1G1YF41_9BACT|nr:MAG: hypothetical protein A3J59_01165 [Candidatus Buchananbacteria bacterium RIFCSPHIGHO2_02_FULL_56_16]